MKLVSKPAAVAQAARARLSDSRLSNRLADMVEVLLDDPAASFPAVFDDAELEGAYRLLSNKAVTPDGILGPHFEATAARLATAGDVLVVHDTTEFRFAGEREGLGLLGAGGGRGFFGHFALAVSTEEHREPYGVVGLATHVREEIRDKRRESDRNDPERESLRWAEMIDVVTKRCPGVRPIHVMDREGDIYDVMLQLLKANGRFVIRSKHDRFVDDEGMKMTLTARFEREVPRLMREAALSARKLKRPTANGALPDRDRRTAKLEVSGARVRLVAPRRFKGKDEALDINVVVVVESNPPEGEDPITWRLLTSEPIATPADLAKVIDAYRGRWVIEEYFKALKTGCAYESRQLTTLWGLQNALAMFVPIAWHLLLIRSTARMRPNEPASSYLTAAQLMVLSKTKRAKLPANATVRDALLAIARWGGWRAHNGEPGWLIIGRGFRKLLAAEEGYLLAM